MSGAWGPLPRTPVAMEAAWAELRSAVDRQHRALMRHQERYIKAWLAATGIHPTEAELVQQDHGRITITIQRRSKP